MTDVARTVKRLSLENRIRLKNATPIFGTDRFSHQACVSLEDLGLAEHRKGCSSFSNKPQWRLTPKGIAARAYILSQEEKDAEA